MFKRGNKEFVLGMLIACQNILDYTQNMNFQAFVNDNSS